MAEVLIHGEIGGREESLSQAMEKSGVSRVVLDNGDLETGLKAFSGSREKPLVIIGPEAPAADGVADYLRAEGYPVFGASKINAQYEAMKSKAVRMARNANITHPDTFIAEDKWMASAAYAYVEGHDPQNYVIKANGLARGKGVILPNTREEAYQTVKGLIDGSLLGKPSKVILFSRRKHGPEVSAMVVVGSGKDDFVLLPLSQDHKRLLDGDKGPNTGGKGAYAPVPTSIVNAKQYQKIHEKTYASLAGIEADGLLYQGAVLNMNLMMSDDLTGEQADDSDLIEYNVRFGDPEIQAVMPLLLHAGVNMYRFLRSAAEYSLENPGVNFADIGYAALSVCLSAAGYPNKPRTGDMIYGLDRQYEGVTVQFAGVTRDEGGPILTNGGRVLYVTGEGETIDIAAARAYAAIGYHAIHFKDYHVRKDIGWQARREWN